MHSIFYQGGKVKNIIFTKFIRLYKWKTIKALFKIDLHHQTIIWRSWPRFELRLSELKSDVLTITPYDRVIICTNNDNLSILVSRDLREIHRDFFYYGYFPKKNWIFLALGSPIRPQYLV